MKKLLLLAIAGVAVKLFLDSETGHELKQHIRDMIQDAQDAVTALLEKVTDKIEDTASTVDQAVANKTAY